MQRVGAEKVRPSQVDGSTEVVDRDSTLAWAAVMCRSSRSTTATPSGFDEEDPVQRPMSGPAQKRCRTWAPDPADVR